MTGAYLSKLNSKAATALLDIYQPIIRGYFAVVALYYAVMSVTHFYYFDGISLFAMAGVSILATIASAKGFYDARKRLATSQVEWRLMLTNALMVVNVVVALNLEFRSEKMTYFIIMVMIFALVGVSFRQALLAILFALVALLSFASYMPAEQLNGYVFLVFAAAMASLSITFFLRRSVINVANAKIDAEEQLEEAKVVGETLRARSLSDSLTSLPNRRAFFEELRRAKAQAKADDQDLWLVLIDLDGFKAVNDIHGHLVGDLLLQSVAQRLLEQTKGEAHVSRMGGDEFNLLFQGKWSESSVAKWNESLLAALAEPYSIEGRSVRISGSIGCKQIDMSGDMRSQINQADFALMTAKAQGKNRSVLFTSEHAQQAKERLEIEKALRSADLAQEIELVFQPQVDLSREEVVRAEALARWSSPTVGVIQPSQFIKIAEESGLIGGITLAVVERAFAELQSWENPIPISVNLSSHDLISDAIIDQIINQTRDKKIDAALVEFEVTETAMMTDFDKATNNLRRLAEAGFTIALDDFGTGYSNFNYLRRLPIGKLKVDRSFMENPSDPMTEKVLFSLAGMARTLGVHCLLEGVEDEVDLLMAKRVGADAVQGFLFGEPMSAQGLQEMVKAASKRQSRASA